jgi:hypothetical protein
MRNCVDPTKGKGCIEIDKWFYGIFDAGRNTTAT